MPAVAAWNLRAKEGDKVLLKSSQGEIFEVEPEVPNPSESHDAYIIVWYCVCVANRPIWRFQYVSIQQNTATENLIPSYESYSIKCTDWNYVKLIVRWRWPACQRLWEIWWTIVELMKRSRCQMSCPRSLKVLTVDHPSLFCIGVGSREQVQTLFCSIFQSTCWMVLKKTVANVANEFTSIRIWGEKTRSEVKTAILSKAWQKHHNFIRCFCIVRSALRRSLTTASTTRTTEWLLTSTDHFEPKQVDKSFHINIHPLLRYLSVLDRTVHQRKFRSLWRAPTWLSSLMNWYRTRRWRLTIQVRVLLVLVLLLLINYISYDFDLRVEFWILSWDAFERIETNRGHCAIIRLTAYRINSKVRCVGMGQWIR